MSSPERPQRNISWREREREREREKGRERERERLLGDI
jgi:hypothetical protein